MTAPRAEAESFPELVAAAATPIDDVRGTAAYRRHALRVLTPRARSRGRCAMRIALRVNGAEAEADCWGASRLLFALREKLGFPGSKNACEQGECGSCSVLLDGVLVCSCLVLAARPTATTSTTVEGLADGDELHPRAAGVRRGRRGPVRVLHAWARGRAVDLLERSRAVRRRDPRGSLRESVPVHGLREDLRRGAAGCRGERVGADAAADAPRSGASASRASGPRRGCRR